MYQPPASRTISDIHGGSSFGNDTIVTSSSSSYALSQVVWPAVEWKRNKTVRPPKRRRLRPTHSTVTLSVTKSTSLAIFPALRHIVYPSQRTKGLEWFAARSSMAMRTNGMRVTYNGRTAERCRQCDRMDFLVSCWLSDHDHDDDHEHDNDNGNGKRKGNGQSANNSSGLCYECMTKLHPLPTTTDGNGNDEVKINGDQLYELDNRSREWRRCDDCKWFVHNDHNGCNLIDTRLKPSVPAAATSSSSSRNSSDSEVAVWVRYRFMCSCHNSDINKKGKPHNRWFRPERYYGTSDDEISADDVGYDNGFNHREKHMIMLCHNCVTRCSMPDCHHLYCETGSRLRCVSVLIAIAIYVHHALISL